MNAKLCAICAKPYKGFGHNAQPLKNGRCCDACNARVLVARLTIAIALTSGRQEVA